MNKEWWKSNTKRGAVIAGIGAIVTTIGLMDQGTLELVTGITLIITEIGGILTIVGVRNAIASGPE